MRYTKKFIQARFERFCEATGQRPAKAYNDVGGLMLDHYRGWNIVVIANEGGAQSHINGWCNRLTASELVAFMDGAMWAAKAIKTEGK